MSNCKDLRDNATAPITPRRKLDKSHVLAVFPYMPPVT